MKLLVTVALLLTTPLAFADELDNEKSVTNVTQRAKDLPATLIMRTNNETGEVEVAHLKEALAEKEMSVQDATQIAFTKINAEQSYSATQFNELDNESSRVSWYFYYGYGYYPYSYGYSYYYPTYNYYGYSYAYYPYYGYGWGAYSYAYYRYSPYWW